METTPIAEEQKTNKKIIIPAIALIFVVALGVSAFVFLKKDRLLFAEAIAIAQERLIQAESVTQDIEANFSGSATQNGTETDISVHLTSVNQTAISESIEEILSKGNYSADFDINVNEEGEVININGDANVNYRIIDGRAYVNLANMSVSFSPSNFFTALMSGFVEGFTAPFKEQWVYVDLDDPVAGAEFGATTRAQAEFLKDFDLSSIVKNVENLEEKKVNNISSYGYVADLDIEAIFDEIEKFFENQENREAWGITEDDYRIISGDLAELEVGIRSAVSNLRFEVWLDKNTYDFVQLKFSGDINYSESGESLMGTFSSMTSLSGYNDPVVVEAPLNAKSIEEIFGGPLFDENLFGPNSADESFVF